ncbi:hypothetical protein ACF3NR_10275 [Vaginella massiliensis]|uniref:hypothetical protein n=1 Tax=Vaginella massiliensis TaxID=1816680 RepID=UPI003752B67E
MKKIDDLFKQQLTQPQEPPADSWATIEEALHPKKKKNRAIPLWVYGSTAASLLLVGIYFYFDRNPIHHTEKEKHYTNSKIVKQSGNTKIEDNLTEIEAIEAKNEIRENFENSTQNSSKYSFNPIYFHDEYDHLYSKVENNYLTENQLTCCTFVYQITREQNLIDLQPVAENAKNEDDIYQAIQHHEMNLSKAKPKSSTAQWKVMGYTLANKIANQNQSLLFDDARSQQIQNQLVVGYGAKVSYQLNDKLALRTGIAKLDFRQQTQNIQIESVGARNAMINAKSETYNSNIRYKNNVRVLSSKGVVDQQFQSVSNRTNLQNQLIQQIGYLELPVEVEYKLLNTKRLELGLVGGTSAMILATNQISARIAENEVVDVGEANNLNPISFSGNASMKLGYKVNERISLNLEPSVHHLFNAVSNVPSKDQTIVGINTGLSINF